MSWGSAMGEPRNGDFVLCFGRRCLGLSRGRLFWSSYNPTVRIPFPFPFLCGVFLGFGGLFTDLSSLPFASFAPFAACCPQMPFGAAQPLGSGVLNSVSVGFSISLVLALR